jgi:hypothetical protein
MESDFDAVTGVVSKNKKAAPVGERPSKILVS